VANEYGEFPVESGIVNDQITAEWSVPERGGQLGITTSGTIQGDDINGAAQLADGSLFAHRMSRNRFDGRLKYM
jgi:hypothetical protein